MDFFKQDKLSAIDAKHMAQVIAFGPVIFQVAYVLRKRGILQAIENHRSKGVSLDALVEELGLSEYGIRVLLESALGMGLVTQDDEGLYRLAKTGYFILHDPLTIINMNFVQDICYKGLFHLDEAIETGKPSGLQELGNWPTVYEGLSQLPDYMKKSWFEFDHYFSDIAFPKVLPMVYDGKIKNLLDIGGNTGKWAAASVDYSPDVHITIMDLPGQASVAEKRIADKGLSERVSIFPANLLDESSPFPSGFDAIWMSQFLDCFSEEEIESIMRRCGTALNEDGTIFILEAFWDRQRFETSAFCLQQTSIYFTAIANGNSQMYHSEVFKKCVERAGFEVVEEIHDIGLCHTLYKCKKAK